MDRKKMERKVVKTIRTYLKPGMPGLVGMNTRIQNDMGMDSMDIMDLNDTVEKSFNFRAPYADWDAFWANSDSTVQQLCDFIEIQIRKNSKHKPDNEEE